MASFPRSGLFGFLLLLAALDPSAAGLASSGTQLQGHGGRPSAPEAQALQGPQADPAPDSVEARLRRISEALREQAPGDARNGASSDSKLAWVFANAPGVGFRNGGWGNGGFRNGGWGNGGFRNGGWGNGGGWRNGGFLNRW